MLVDMSPIFVLQLVLLVTLSTPFKNVERLNGALHFTIPVTRVVVKVPARRVACAFRLCLFQVQCFLYPMHLLHPQVTGVEQFAATNDKCWPLK